MKKFLILSLLLCFFMTNTPLVFAESLSEKQERIEQQAQEEKNKIQEATDKLNEVSEKMRILQAELDEANTESLSEKQERIEQQAQEEKNKIQEATDKLNEVSEKMRILQAELDEANTAYNEIKVKLDNANEQIAQKEKQLADTEQSLKKNQKYLQKRVRDIYIHGQISYLDILFGAKDFSDFLTRMDLIKRILRYDYDLITKIHQERNSIIQTKAELEKEKTATEKLYDETKTKKFALDDKKSALDKMIDRIKYDKETSEKAYKELMNASEQIALMIQRRGASAYVGTGQMIWPLGGPITSEYGWRTHPIYGNARYHSGIDIGGDYGMNIYAADSGTVTYSGWISGYGNTVIIDHGNGVSTLYGHNQSLTVSVGQNISQGDVIAHCGSTGNSTGPHCHFEVRVNGEPTNPYDYL